MLTVTKTSVCLLPRSSASPTGGGACSSVQLRRRLLSEWRVAKTPRRTRAVRTMKKTCAALGSGRSFGPHTSKYLLDHADPAEVIAAGHNLAKYDCLNLDIGEADSRYGYHAYQVNYELAPDGTLRPREAAGNRQLPERGEGAASGPIAWRSPTWRRSSSGAAERFIHIGTSGLYGSVDHAATADLLCRDLAASRPQRPRSGSDLAAFDADRLLAMQRGVPYDAFALWCTMRAGGLHLPTERLGTSGS
jgi:hypothetical protein